MILLSLLLLLIAAVCIYKNKGFDLTSIFCMIWCVVFGGASLRLYGMREYSLSIVIIISLGVFSFVLFSVLGRYGQYIFSGIKYDWLNKPIKRDLKINKTIVNFFLIIITIFILYSFTRMFSLMLEGIPFGTIHAMYLNRGGEAFYQISFLNQIHSKIVIPCLYCLVPIIVYYTMVSFKKNFKYVLWGIADIALYTVATGSRSLIIFLLVDVVLALPFSGIILSKKDFKKIKRIGGIFATLLVVAGIYYTIIRKGFTAANGVSVFSQVFGEIYKYFSLSIPLADYWVEQINAHDIITYGKMSFNSILSIIEWIGAQFFSTGTFPFLDICREVADNLELMQPIFKDASCNAFVTFAFYFYIDFRLIGVLFLSSAWGFLCGRASKRIKYQPNPASILFYLLLAQSVAMSYSRWAFYDAPYLLAFVFLRLFFVQFDFRRR